MESLTRLVTDSLTRHNFHRPVDPQRLQWSPWVHCHSAASLLIIPSRPGILALAEEAGPAHVGTGALAGPADRSTAPSAARNSSAAPRILALLQFNASDDMAYTLDRLFTQPSLLRTRLSSGRCHLRYVIIENDIERRSVYATLNLWLQAPEQKSSLPPSLSSPEFQLSCETPAASYQGAALAVPPVAV